MPWKSIESLLLNLTGIFQGLGRTVLMPSLQSCQSHKTLAACVVPMLRWYLRDGRRIFEDGADDLTGLAIEQRAEATGPREREASGVQPE